MPRQLPPSRFLSVLVALLCTVASAIAQEKAQEKEAGSALKVVSDSLQKDGNFYFVKGSVYNPTDTAVKKVVIKYYIWKKWMGQDGHGSRIKQTGGLVTANIKYLPPKQIVEFTAIGGDNAPVMVRDVPDPLNAEITAEWDR